MRPARDEAMNFVLSNFSRDIKQSTAQIFNPFTIKQSFIDQVTNLTPGIIAVYNIQTRQYIFINKTLKPLLGYEPQEWMEKGVQHVIQLVHPDDLPRLMAENQQALTQEENPKLRKNAIFEFEYRVKHADGNYRWLRTYGGVFDRDSHGKVLHVINISLDVTAIKETEEKLLRLTDELEEKVEKRTFELNQNLKHLKQRQEEELQNAALRIEINEAMSHRRDLGTTMDLCVKAVVGKLQASLAKIWVYDQDSKSLNLLARASSKELSKFQQKIPLWARANDGRIAFEKKSYLTNNVEEDPEIKDKAWARKNKLRSYAGYPLVLDDKLVGVMTLYSQHEITPRTHETLHLVAESIAQGIGRKQAGEALIESERKYHTIFSTLAEGVVLQDSKGKIIAANSSAEKILELNFKQLKEMSREWKNHGEYIQEDNSQFLISDFPFIKALETGEAQKNKVMGIVKGDQTDWLLINSVPLKDELGVPYAVASSFQDITEQKRLEKQKDEFISIASHELKTPLTTIKSFNEILATQFKEEKAQYYLGKMNKEINRLTELVNDLLDVSKIQSGRLTLDKDKIKIGQLVKEVVEDIQTSSPTHQIIIKKSVKAKASIDKFRMYQVLLNLISNAIKYSPKSDKVFVSVQKKKSDLVFKIEDFGIGISKRDQERVFEPFFQAVTTIRQSHSGLGLGLHIVKEIINRHGGDIKVKSKKGVGTIFTFSIPTGG